MNVSDTTSEISVRPENTLFPIMLFEKSFVIGPELIRCRLLNDFYNVANSICRIVAQKNVNMVLICFHGYDFPAIVLSGIGNTSLYCLINIAGQQRFSILCHKNQMGFQEIFPSILSVITSSLHFVLSFSLSICYNYCSEF